MNYLAHLLLARASGHSLHGALLGDVLKGQAWRGLPSPVVAAIFQHRAIDRFTDDHPFVARRRAQFGQGLRRYSGVVIDVAFDHWLSQHFTHLTGEALPEVLAALHAGLTHEWQQWQLAARPELAAHGARVQRMIDERWLAGYGDARNVRLALGGIERRLSRSPSLVALWQQLAPPDMTELQGFYDDARAFAGQFVAPAAD